MHTSENKKYSSAVWELRSVWELMLAKVVCDLCSIFKKLIVSLSVFTRLIVSLGLLDRGMEFAIIYSETITLNKVNKHLQACVSFTCTTAAR